MPTVISGSSLTLPGDGTSPLHAVTRQQTQTLMPAGAILPFAMATAPSGWLKCNGQVVSRTTYADLFAAIGTTYGAGNGTTTFAVPDLRGEFVRGFDDGRGIDSGRTIGSAQAGQMPAHYHDISTQPGTNGGSNIAQTDRGVLDYSNPRPTTTVGGTSNNSENRPRNVSLLYCIKV